MNSTPLLIPTPASRCSIERLTGTLHFADPSQPTSPINSLRSFTGGVIDALLDIQDILLKTNPGDERRSVFINDLGVKFTDFELSEQTKRALIDQGRIATTEYLDKPQQPLPEIKRLRT